MKKNSIKKSLKELEAKQLDENQVKMIKGGTGDSTDDIIVVEIISP